MENAVNRADKILDVAVRKFSQFGYEGVSTTDLAKAAKTSQPSVHYHFGSKLGLWKAAVDEIIARIAEHSTLAADIADASDPLDALTIYSRAVFEASIAFPELGRLMYNEGQIGGERLEYLINSFVGESYGAFIKILEDGIDQGVLKPHRPEQLLFLMHGALVNYFNLTPLVEAAFGHSPTHKHNAEAFFELYVDVILGGITATPKPS